jgi:hypothetical protein
MQVAVSMGKSSDRWYEGEGDWQYPQMRDVLPPQLEKMSLFIHPELIANEWEDGYARLFISALPLDLQNLHFNHVYLEWGMDEYLTNLRVNVELVRQVYSECGVQLEVKEPDYDAYDSKYLGS